jgi:hypothetical protein
VKVIANLSSKGSPMTAAPSVTTFVVGDRLPWSDDVGPSTGSGPLDKGAIYDSASRRECSIRSISSLGATLRAELAKAPGEPVSVELSTGQRPAGIVVWARGGEAGIAFNQPVDLLALINRSLISQPAERRAMPRVDIRCAVHVRWAGTQEPAMMRDISANGLQIQGNHLPGRGTFVSVFVDGLVIPAGEVVWRKQDLAGIELFEELSWTSIVPWIREMMRKETQ